MEHIAPRDKDMDIDLESGVRASVDDSSLSPVSGVKIQAKALLSKVFGVFVDETIKGEDGVNLCANVPNSHMVSVDQGKLGDAKTVDHVEKKVVKEKRKKASNKKAAKPPRPPRGPSLDSADQKLIKEIAELAMLKRARIERMKALKKMKAAKSSSSSSNLFAMVFTVLFCLVVLFQGMSSRGTSANFQGSPVSTEVTDGGLISVQYLGNAPAADLNAPGSGSPNPIVPVAGSDTPSHPRRDVVKRRRF